MQYFLCCSQLLVPPPYNRLGSSGLAGETAALLNLAEKANRVVQRHAAAHLQLRMRHAVLTVMCDWIERGIGCRRVDPIRGGGALGPSSKQVNTQQEV